MVKGVEKMGGRFRGGGLDEDDDDGGGGGDDDDDLVVGVDDDGDVDGGIMGWRCLGIMTGMEGK